MSEDDKLQQEVSKLRQDIAEAIAAQEQLHAQLSAAIEKLSQLPTQRPATADKNQAIQIGRLESRMRSVEQRVERVNGQVTGILESRIWKTLVKGGSFFLRFIR
jgi:predicted RNase H-like nuclease (RuvC/YqgF family)